MIYHDVLIEKEDGAQMEVELPLRFAGHGHTGYLLHWLPVGATLAAQRVSTYIQ